MNITLTLDIDNKTLTISGTGSTLALSYVYVDTSKSFICQNEPSSLATSVPLVTIQEQGATTYSFTGVVDFKTNLNGILGTADINEDIFFVFAQINSNPEYVVEYTYNDANFKANIFESTYRALIESKCCELNLSAANLILLYNAFLMAPTLKDKAELWNNLHNNPSVISNCSCNG